MVQIAFGFQNDRQWNVMVKIIYQLDWLAAIKRISKRKSGIRVAHRGVIVNAAPFLSGAVACWPT